MDSSFSLSQKGSGEPHTKQKGKRHEYPLHSNTHISINLLTQSTAMLEDGTQNVLIFL